MKNMAASVRTRLLQNAKSSNRPFQEVLQYYGMERFLYRLSLSPYSSRFILKGALLLRAWQAPESRPTRDIDLLGFMGNNLSEIAKAFREICTIQVENDGLIFDSETVKTEIIKENADYPGTRVLFDVTLDKAVIPMQIDIGFGDVITPEEIEIQYPTILDFPAPKLRGYPLETVIAEKYHAIVALGTINSRMKDFYDIWFLSRKLEFNGSSLSKALKNTFENRNTELNADPVALTSAFSEGEFATKQWQAFVKRLSLQSPPSFAEIALFIFQFVRPMIADPNAEKLVWAGGGPWK